MTNPPGIGALNLKAVLFDLGGTLHHYRREEVFRAVLKEKGIEVRIDEVLRAYDVTDPNLCPTNCGTTPRGHVAGPTP
jgi:hypothetical protein